jgi:hypothetical protein
MSSKKPDGMEQKTAWWEEHHEKKKQQAKFTKIIAL